MINTRSAGAAARAARALVPLVVLLVGALADAGGRGPEDPRYLSLGETVKDTLEEYTDVHNFLLEMPVPLQHDDIVLTFEWESGLPWFLLKCDERPSIFPLDATWVVQPERGETSASLELANHQCYGTDKQLWLKVYAFNPVFDYTISFVALHTRLTSLAMNFRPSFEIIPTKRLPATDVYFYKFAHPPSAAKAMVTSYELFGHDINADIPGCSIQIGFWEHVTDRHGQRLLAGRGFTPDTIPCRLLKEGRRRQQLRVPIDMSDLAPKAQLYVSVSSTLSVPAPSAPSLGYGYGQYNLAQTAYVATKGNRDTLPNSISAAALRLASADHRPFAVSFDYVMPKELNLYDEETPVFTLDGLVGAASWQYYTYTVVGPVAVDFRFSAEAEGIAAYMQTSGVPTEDSWQSRIPNFADEDLASADERPPYSRVHQTATTMTFGVRGSTKTTKSKPFSLVVSANHAKPLSPFVVTPGVVKVGRWTYYHARLRRTARIQVPIRVPADSGLELYIAINELPSVTSSRATDVDGSPGVKCVEMPLGGDGTLYVGVHGAAADDGEDVARLAGSGSGGKDLDFDMQLLLNGFAECNFYED